MVQDNIIFNTPSTPKSAQSAARSRMRAEKRKADIFRMRPGDQFYDPVRHCRYNADKKKNHSSSGASGLFNSKFLTDNSAFAQVLCFANPVRGNSQEDEKDPAIDNSDYLSNDDDTNTLNTCEDTITSTLAYEAQFSHMVESRPPMPLFMHFQVPCEEDHQNNELTKIVTTGSHRSFNLWQVIHSEVPEAPSTPLKSNNSPNKSSPVHIHHNIDTHDRVDVTPNSRTKSRSIEHTTPMIIVDPQVKHHPKKSHGNNTRQQNHSHVRARPPHQQSPSSSTNSAPSTPKQHWQRLPVIISPSSSQDANHQQQEEEESQELSPTSFDQTAPATPTAYRKAISKSSSSSSTASSSSDETRTSSASSLKRIDGITVNLEKRMRCRNEPVIISPSSTPRNKVSPKHGNHVSIKTPSTATSSPHDSLPHMLKLRNSSNSISPTTPVCSTSRSTSLEGLSSSTHSVSPQKVLVSPGGDGEGSSSVTHRVAV
uniref:Uncharacterized protein n=1 Tax=Ditylum brightwellii TaxID=49249 RepID=A0A7S2EM81_9STRA